jgi:deazaflavin-dependent oxidoreductase (nitroreductase family)
LHRLLYRRSGGRLGGEIWGLPVLLLTTTGRETRRARTVPLCSLRDGDDLVVIASYGGLDRPPSWWLNLQRDPHATVQLGAETFPVVARDAAGDERTRLWGEVTSRAPGYLDYERRTDRVIPVVVLSRD